MQPTAPQIVTINDIPGFVKTLFFDAYNSKASDVHVEPTSISVRIRLRIDGALQEYTHLALVHHEQLLTHLKVLANLDVSALYTPQDGQFLFNFTLPNQNGEQEQVSVNIRISVFPTINGDAAVFRVASGRGRTFSLDTLGMTEEMLTKVRTIITKNYGMTLVTGPVGSGKTTALYSALNETMTEDKNIVTLEDPVEIRFDNIRQIEINQEHGMTLFVWNVMLMTCFN
jgi:general secretion pathway protein E